MNILGNVQEIADLIIRPNRYLYKPIDLGPKTFSTPDSTQPIHHHQFQFKNKRKQILKASLYTSQTDIQLIENIIVYLHCNSGCRIQGLAYLNMIINHGFSYFVFDFGGSGVSEGKYISLGYFQADDIQAAILFIKKKIKKEVKIGLWGRSMGAVAGLRYLMEQQAQQIIKAAIFDSPFYSLNDLFISIGRQKTSFPKIVLEVAMKYLKPIILRKAKFDMDSVTLDDIDKIKNCPGIFIASKNDLLIPYQQMDRIFKKYNGKKQMLFVEESHNQPRHKSVIEDAFLTLKKYFEEDNEKEIFLVTETKKQDSLQGQVCYRSQLPSKQVSRKKLQLTIKSYSQKSLLQPSIVSKKQKQTPTNKQGSIGKMDKIQKRQICCLFEKRRTKKIKLLKQEEVQNQNNQMDQFAEDSISLNNSLNFKHFKPKKTQTGLRKFFKEEVNSENYHNKVEEKRETGKLENVFEREKSGLMEAEGRQRNLSLKVIKQNMNIKNQINLMRKQQQSEKVLLTKKEPLKIKIPDNNSYRQKNNFERKTMQHIANKKPPLIDNQNHKMVRLRNSFEVNYKSQFFRK